MYNRMRSWHQGPYFNGSPETPRYHYGNMVPRGLRGPYYDNRLFPNYGYADPPTLRSSHLDIKYAQCAENKDGHKISYHIISRLDAMSNQMGRFGSLKIKFSSKVAKFASKIGIDLTFNFCTHDILCAILIF